MADEQEQAVGRWFLEHLEQGVGGRGLEVIDAVDDDGPPRRQSGSDGEQFAEAADLVDADVAGELAGLFILDPLEKAKIGVAARRHQPPDSMLARHRKSRTADWRPGGFGENA